MGNKSQKSRLNESNMDAANPIANLPKSSTNLPIPSTNLPSPPDDFPSPPDNLTSPKGKIVQKYSKYESNKPKYSSTCPELREIKTQENNNNMIKMRLYINFNNVNRPTKILYNIKEKVPGCNIKELNEENTELYINGKQNKYKSYFIPEKEGIYDILLIIKILMTNCCCLFYDINNLESLDLSSFNTQNVTNMSYMFFNCKKLTNLYLSSFNTQNVTDMSYMFYRCSDLKSLDLSSFDTNNVTDMSYMFNFCSNLKYLDLSSFNIKGVTDVNDVFNGCLRLDRIILSFEASNISRFIRKDRIIYV